MYRSKKLKKFFEKKYYFFSRKNGYETYKGLNCGRGSKDKKEYCKKFKIRLEKMRVKKTTTSCSLQQQSD